MRCFKCNMELDSGANYCAYCGAQVNNVPYTTITISKKEAKTGCQKIVNIATLAAPIRLNLKAGIAKGTRLEVSNAKFNENGTTQSKPLYIIVQVK